MAHGLPAKAMVQRNAALAKQSFGPVDVAGYLTGSQESYAALWVQGKEESEAADMSVGLEERPSQEQDLSLNKRGYRHLVHSFHAGADGRIRYSVIWAKSPKKEHVVDYWFEGPELQYAAEFYPDRLQVDVSVGKAGPIPGTRERFTRQLQVAEKKLEANRDDAQARLQRGEAYYYLGEMEKAVGDFSWLIEKFPKVISALNARAVAYARLGKVKEARGDLAKIQEVVTLAEVRLCQEAKVLAYLGEDVKGLKPLEKALSADTLHPNFLYLAVSSPRLCTGFPGGKW